MWKKFSFALLVFAFLPLISPAQFSDDFTDGDFTNSPNWAGDDAKFEVLANQLHLNGPAVSDTAYLATALGTISFSDPIVWEFWIDLQFDPSNSNNVRVMLLSDQANIRGSFNGYFIRIGENGATDRIKLYRQDGNTATVIHTGTANTFGTTPIVRVRVTRDGAANWTIETDDTGGTNFVNEGGVTDATHSGGTFFGVYCKYSTANSTGFYFDDFNVTATSIVDTDAPIIDSLVVTANNTVEVHFNEDVDQTTAETTTNYNANNGLNNPTTAVRNGIDNSMVTLTFGTTFTNGLTNTLTVTNVEDLVGNAIVSENDDFVYFVPATAGYKEVVFNELLADPTPQVGLPDAEFVELYNTSANIFDLANWQFVNSTTSKTLPNHILLPGEFVILCSSTDVGLYSGYGDVIGITSWTSLTNSADSLTLLDNNGTLIDVVSYNSSWYQDAAKDDGGWTLELVNPTTPCSGANNWIASNDASGGTPAAQNSVYNTTPDTQAPEVSNITVVSNTQIVLHFNEPMDSTSLANGTYAVNLGIAVTGVTVNSTDFTSVLLDLSPAIDTAILYTATVTGVNDCSGNAIGANNGTFIIGIGPAVGEVIINEIFADPTPAVGLPEFEYIELFNKTNKLLDLSNCTFEGATIASGLIQPNGYVILCADDDTASFSPFGDVIGLTSWPTLTNSGEDLVFENANNNVVDALIYSDTWYGDPDKEEGGWSLELINPNHPCTSASNWRASTDPDGGTPGALNAVYDPTPDTQGPQLERVLVTLLVKIEAYFDEPLDSNSVLTANYSVSGGIPILNVANVAPNYTSVVITFAAPIDTGIVYTLTVTGLTDCSGNAIGNNNADFVLPFQGKPGDLIINEVLFNPVTGGADFVEVYNNSEKVLDINDWRLANFDNDTIDNIRFVTENLVMYPGDYALLTTDPTGTIAQYPGAVPSAMVAMASLPGYNNDSSTVYLITNENLVSDQFSYDEDMHFGLLNDNDGVSLERIDFDRPSNEATNWHSAAESVGFATPGYENSQYYPTAIPDDAVSVDPEVFSPDNDGFQDVVNIQYQLDGPGYVGNLTIYDSHGRLVKLLVENELLSTEGTFSWDGTNEQREKARIGIYVIFFEIFDLNGNVTRFKRSCVVASKL